jgi:hypothetical protein
MIHVFEVSSCQCEASEAWYDSDESDKSPGARYLPTRASVDSDRDLTGPPGALLQAGPGRPNFDCDSELNKGVFVVASTKRLESKCKTILKYKKYKTHPAPSSL